MIHPWITPLADNALATLPVAQWLQPPTNNSSSSSNHSRTIRHRCTPVKKQLLSISSHLSNNSSPSLIPTPRPKPRQPTNRPQSLEQRRRNPPNTRRLILLWPPQAENTRHTNPLKVAPLPPTQHPFTGNSQVCFCR